MNDTTKPKPRVFDANKTAHFILCEVLQNEIEKLHSYDWSDTWTDDELEQLTDALRSIQRDSEANL